MPVTYLVLDGHFGNAPTLQMTRQHHLHLISKWLADSALYLPDTGPYAGRGPRRKYGKKLDLRYGLGQKPGVRCHGAGPGFGLPEPWQSFAI